MTFQQLLVDSQENPDKRLIRRKPEQVKTKVQEPSNMSGRSVNKEQSPSITWSPRASASPELVPSSETDAKSSWSLPAAQKAGLIERRVKRKIELNSEDEWELDTRVIEDTTTKARTSPRKRNKVVNYIEVSDDE